MSEALVRHDAALQSVIDQHRGYVFKRVGDAFCASFASATDALACAIEAQRHVAQETNGVLHVRIALHSGEAQERDADYFGPALNRVARLLAIAYGDQILLSSSTAQLCKLDLPRDVVLRDLGTHRLKDLSEPERVYQACARGLRDDFPTLRSEENTPNNLPLQLTRLLGREAESKTVRTLLGKTRLVTLAGAGGIGKTRLALDVGASVLERFPDGVWFVELAEIADPELVASAVASAVNVRESQGQALTATLAKSLAHKTALLIFDNCEHLVDSAARVADALLHTCANVRILATSRQPLGIAGETVHRVESLTYPSGGEAPSVKAALRFSAVALFCERANAADSNFKLTAQTVPIVSEICAHLDGIALAIELAAARVKIFSPAALNDRLSERFRLLTGGSRTALPRQQTMRALIDWSYELLDERERAVLRRLGAFIGDFAMDAIEFVCLADGETVSSLVEKSLVATIPSQPEHRYRLLESTREYALEKLREAGDFEAAAALHIEYYAGLAREACERTQPLSPEWFARLDCERDNFRVALSRALVEGRDRDRGAQLAAQLSRYWYEGGYFGEGSTWIARALDAVDGSSRPSTAARLRLAQSMLASGAQKVEAARQSAALFETAGDRIGRGDALSHLGLGLRQLRRWDEAADALRAAAQLLDESGDASSHAVTLLTLGSISAYVGRYDEANDLYARVLQTASGVGYAAMAAHLYMADLHFHRRAYDRAVAEAAEALGLAEQTKNRRYSANARCNLAVYRTAAHRYAEAADDAREALQLLRESQNGIQLALAVQHMALLTALGTDPAPAARLLGYVDGYFYGAEYEREPTDEWSRKRLGRILRAKLEAAEFKRLYAEGSALTESQAVAIALATRAQHAVAR